MPVILDAQAGRKAYITLTPDPAGSAADLAALSDFLDSCTAAGLTADVCLWPQPYNAGLTASQYKSMVGYYGPTVRGSFPLVYQGLAGTGTGGTLATFQSYYPGAAAVDKVTATFTASGYAAGVRLGATLPAGAYLNNTQMGAADFTAAKAMWDGWTGRPLTVARYYKALSGFVYDTQMQQMAAAGVKCCLTLRPAYNPVSSSDLASMTTLLQSMKAAGLQADITLWHEPYYQGLTADQYKACVAYYGPTVRQYYPLFFVTGAASVQFNNENSYYPGDSQIDGIATDLYCWSNLPANGGTTLDQAAALADAGGKPFGLWEFNSSTDVSVGQTQAQASAFFDYVRAFFQARADAGKPNADILFFNSGTSGTLTTLITSGTDYRVGLYNSVQSSNFAAVADNDAKPFGVQIAVDSAQPQATGTAYMDYVQSFMYGRYAAGKTLGDVFWNDTGTTVLPAGSYLIGEYQALYDALTAGVPAPPPPPPEPGGGGIIVSAVIRRDWHFVLGPPSGGHQLELAQASARSVTWRLTDAHEASFTCNAAAGYDTGITPLATDLHVIRGGQELFRGRVGPSSDELDSGAHAVTFTAVSYRGILDRRILYAGSQLKWANTDIGNIAWGLVTQTQGRTGGNLGIIKGLGIPLGMSGSKTCEAGDVVADKINDLAYVDSSMIGAGGFDWDVTARDGSTLTLDLWPIARGAAKGIVLQYGDNLTGPKWSRTADTAGFADALRMSGGGGTPPTPVELDAPDIGARPEGRWDASYNSDESDANRLTARAALQLNAAARVIPAWTIPLRPGVWQGPDHLWIGDTVAVFAGSGRLQAVETLRVLELTASIGPNGEEITLTIGAPRPDLRRKLAAIVKQLQKSRKHSLAGLNWWSPL